MLFTNVSKHKYSIILFLRKDKILLFRHKRMFCNERKKTLKDLLNMQEIYRI